MDFTGYNPPGIYVEDLSGPIVTSAGALSTLACIVGPAVGYQTNVETIVLSDVDEIPVPVQLRQRGIFQTDQTGPPAISGLVVTDTAGGPLALDVDYSIATVTSVPDVNANNFTTITRIDGGAISNNDAIIAYYNFADLSYYSPQIFQDYTALAAVYGQPFDLTTPSQPVVSSPLSVAASVAMNNGATQIMTIATNPSDGDFNSQLRAAYAKVDADYRVGIIVPLFVDGYQTNSDISDTATFAGFESVVADIKNHVEAASANGFGRIAVIGAPTNFDDDTSGSNTIAIATTTSSKRIVEAYPNRLNLSVDNGYTIEVGGYYLASAYAALLTSGQVNRGLTKRQVSGFSSLPTTFTTMSVSTKNTLSKNGVAVTEIDRLSRFTVRHGVTTKMSALNYREISLVRIADTLYQMVYTGLEAADLIGEPITLETTTDVKNILSGILERAVNDLVIIDWQNLLVRQESVPGGDPTVIDCKFAYQPAVPLNYINVGFTIDLTSGTVTETAA